MFAGIRALEKSTGIENNFQGVRPPPKHPYLVKDILLNEMVIAITHAILGDEVTNTACPGSERQNVHGDGGQLWPGLDAAHPPFGLAVNIPLVDVDENKGATRLWPGTCSIAKSAAAARCAPVPL